MTAEIKTIVSQLNIVGGAWCGDAPNQVAVREPTSADVPGAGKGDLFVLTEIYGSVSNRQTLERQLAQTVRDAYYLARGSITASLRRALQAAGDQLFEYNYEVGVDERVIAGIVALAISDEDAFIAQIGPAAFFAVLGDYVCRYPAESIWLDEALGPEQEEDEPALGISKLVEPNLHHLRLSPGDMLILADSRLAGQLPLEEVVKAVSSNHVKGAVKNLGKAAQASDCSAMVLEVVEAGQSAFGVLKRNAPSRLGRFFDHHHPQPVTAEAGPSPSTEPVPVAEAGAEPQPTPEAPPVAAPPPSEYAYSKHKHKSPPARRGGVRVKKETPAQTEEHYDYEAGPQTGQKGTVLTSMAHEPTFSPEWRRDRARKPSLPFGRVLRWLGAGLLVLAALLGSGLKTILTLVLPGAGAHAPRQAGAQAHRHQPSAVSWTLLRNIAIAIPLLVALVVGVSYLQKGRQREAEYTEFVSAAQNKFQQAQAVMADPGAALGLISEAEAALVEAEKIKNTQPEITDLRKQMAEVADEIGHVQRLYYLPQLRQYTDSGTNLKNIVVQGVEIYVLDSGTDRVFHHRLDDLGETLLPDDETLLLVSREQQVEDVTVGDLLGMTWMPAGGNRQTSDLVILNSTGLLEYNPNFGITTSAMAGGDLLARPIAVSSYFGNFYVLDPQARRLLRYLPTADGYSASPEDYFPADQPVDLSNAVDFAIDGAIYVLFQDGRIGKYERGQPVEFNVTGLDRPFNNPASIFTAPDEEAQYVYVADAGNQRVVQLEKDGRFVRQFKPREGETVVFANLQDIFVDEIGGRLYILDSNNLYAGNIPSESIE